MMLDQPHMVYGLEWRTDKAISVVNGAKTHLQLNNNIYKRIPSLALMKAKIKRRAQPNFGPSAYEIPVKYEHITECANLLVQKYFYNENG
jgi:hypothetical protein